ncbi:MULTISPECIES: YqfO family protein [Virgibacillus]|uniref:Uncharacterized protein n=2 Tax=Virgibacillus TaxID=84406 RepID=A0A024QF50_9BACI|nr:MULTISPECIES: hypothetical protein [Virgibacillus]EQB35286.1 hypothetical protein M948_19495 [Virgibacillus sp. CM-4]MYL42684.1 hypothetical protein [Virgibacillus massiliensis]GGJ76022.1 hypothetical protein GCM10007111_41970 [Virgibacillus kapii]CDQ40571.1 hypothetical protein BN990_02896 [Virgibacillus massiliensis]
MEIKLVPIYRIKTYVPPEYLQKVMEGILQVDSLRYGNYQQVMWHSNGGAEQFAPSEDAIPTQGDIGATTKLTSIRLEFSIPREQPLLVSIIEEGIYPNHPWDEPVIQVAEELETRKWE